MAVTTRLIEYSVDGKVFEGMLAWNDTMVGARPGVMVCHAWSGRQKHEEDAARALAELGYVGFAADVFGKGVRGSSVEENTALMTPLMEDRPGLFNILNEALMTMKGQGEVHDQKMAVIGYCFGGLCALDMARNNAGFQGAVAFHALLGDAGASKSDPIMPKVLALHGYDDPMADADQQRLFTDEMTARKADWQLHLYGGVSHAFTNEGANDPNLGLHYDAVAAARSWRSMTGFLQDLFTA